MTAEVSAEPGTVARSGDVLLEVRDLQTHFKTPAGVVRAVDGVSFDVPAGASVGIVGESGSGKSVTSLSIMRLISSPGFIAGGQILFQGRDIASLSEREFRPIRGRDLALVFQDPMSALNPVYPVGKQVAEALRAHQKLTRGAALERAVELFSMVGIPVPERRVHEYPHKLSGGMRQRVTIAMALANEPSLLILDEPTTALDATIQAQILDLIRDLRSRVNTAVLLISHDIGVVAEICEEVVVMYGGRVMERGSVEQVTKNPRHPYTIGLLNSIPSPEMKGRKLSTIGGTVPNPLRMPPGCPFQPRCPKAMDICSTKPELSDAGDGRRLACWLA
ncbi:ABC transporter ATP-binding protein [Amycolatopsis sp.]|jgi:oligopeptide/dipeptide ABC transporter ATP-binding protein|uniref:ABC transporter ATP-binding protein n=1 Tax=Amycolatopsis sp. TaxID=37632 RepID=UPI002DF84337|nr:ABC transporter ATP-binding protein [Amycolatopsis sp.]